MGFGMTLGHLANGFNSAVRSIEDMAEKTDQQDRRKYAKRERDNNRRVWDEAENDRAALKRIYGGQDAPGAEQAPPQQQVQPHPADTSEPPSALRTMELREQDKPVDAPSSDTGVAKPVDTAVPKTGYGMTTEMPRDVAAPGMTRAAPAGAPGASGTNGAAKPGAERSPDVAPPTQSQPGTSQFASSKDEQYYNYLLKTGRPDKAQEFKNQSIANRQTNDVASFQGNLRTILQQPGGLNNPENLARARDAALSAGQFDQYAKFSQAHDSMMWRRSGQAMDELVQAAKGMTPQQVAQEAAKIFNSDVGAGNVEDIKVDPATGAISFKATNKITGQSQVKSFKSADDMLSSLNEFYRSPENLDAIRKQNVEWLKWKREKDYEQAGKIALEREKGANRNGVTVDENGNLVVNAPPARGRSTKADAGSTNSPAYDILFNANEKTSNDFKLSPDDMVKAAEYIDLITANNPALKNNPSTVARIAREIQLGSTSADGAPVTATVPTIDFKNGRLVRAYRDAATGQTINLGSINDGALDKEGRASMAQEIASALNQEPMDSEMRGLWKGAARGDAQAKKQLLIRRQYQRENEIKDMIYDQNRRRAANGQPPLNYSSAEIRSQAQDALQSIERTLQMMARYGYKGE